MKIPLRKFGYDKNNSYLYINKNNHIMSKRKTIEVSTMVEWANTQLARTDEYADKGFKSGISTMIERILHNTNNYNGFMFNDSEDSECGTLGYYSRKYFYRK